VPSSWNLVLDFGISLGFGFWDLEFFLLELLPLPLPRALFNVPAAFS
jgi:hypothetical protein